MARISDKRLKELTLIDIGQEELSELIDSYRLFHEVYKVELQRSTTPETPQAINLFGEICYGERECSQCGSKAESLYCSNCPQHP